MLSRTFSSKGVEPVTRWYFKVINSCCGMEMFKLAYSTFYDFWWKSNRFPGSVKIMCMFVSKSLNHIINVMCHVTRVNSNMGFFA